MRRNKDRCPTCGQLRPSGKKLEFPVLCEKMIEKLEADNKELRAALQRKPTTAEHILATDRSKM